MPAMQDLLLMSKQTNLYVTVLPPVKTYGGGTYLLYIPIPRPRSAECWPADRTCESSSWYRAQVKVHRIGARM